jgi:anti-sigma regulatory factor (Ser/Thr protein kinase)
MSAPLGLRHELSLNLPAVHRGVRVARSLLMRFARMEGLSDDEASSIGLVASEMLANAIDHGEAGAAMTEDDLKSDVRMGLKLVISPRHWTLDVSDQCGGDAEALSEILRGAADFDPLDDRGRGMFMMRAYVDELVVAKSEDGLGLTIRAMKRNASQD